LFETLLLYYATLNNLITRLFAIWDRSVNGSVGWSEVLAGLSLLVLEPFRTKFKLAFALVDFNGDGQLVTREFVKFYSECFLPLTKYLKATQPDIFPTLDRQSAMYNIYEHVKPELGEKPHYLNDDYAIAYYNGGCFENNRAYVITEALRIRTTHCSMEGANFDLLIEANDDVVLTNIVVGGNYNFFTSYLKDALVWFYDKKPDWTIYSSKFDDYTRELFDKLPLDAPHRPHLFITTDEATTLAFVEIEPPVKARYVHVKFLRPHPGGKHRNIDLEFFGMWGYFGHEVPKKRVKVSSKSLYAELGGRVDEEGDWVKFNEGQASSLDTNISPYVAQFLKAASRLAEGQELPQSASAFHIKAEEVEKLLDSLNFIEAEDGGMHINQASILRDVIPIVHMFRLFYGYPAMDVLLTPM